MKDKLSTGRVVGTYAKQRALSFEVEVNELTWVPW